MVLRLVNLCAASAHDEGIAQDVFANLIGLHLVILTKDEVIEANKNDSFDWSRCEEIDRMMFESIKKGKVKMIDWDAPSEPMSYKFEMDSPRALNTIWADMTTEIYVSLEDVVEDGKSYILRWRLEEVTE